MSSLPTSEPRSKGPWLTSREIEALTAAEEAGNMARCGRLQAQGARAASQAQSQALQSCSWRARFMALAVAVLQPELVDPRSLAEAIIQTAPSARVRTVRDENDLCECEEAANRFYERAYIAHEAGHLTTTVSNDEIRAVAVSLLDLIGAVRDLA